MLFLQSLAYAADQVATLRAAAPWNEDVSLTHSAETFAAMVNNLTASGFRIERAVEPELTAEQKERYPHKQAWMARYVGIIIFRHLAHIVDNLHARAAEPAEDAVLNTAYVNNGDTVVLRPDLDASTIDESRRQIGLHPLAEELRRRQGQADRIT